jgi:aspartyl-tRNA(Asn)/glutamyl-tRNA(Gln) amidotransferase subunit C
MKISREDALHVAALAHLELSEAEVETYRRQLDEILSYVEKLNELDTTQIEPMAQVLAGTDAGEAGAWREDAVLPCELADEALASAPDPAPPFFRVPRVIER